jgi:hypothetical protein
MTQTVQEIKEHCPNCKQAHSKGKTQVFDNIHQTPDILCPCGNTLRWSVPVFKTTESGWVLRNLYQRETARL